MDERLLYASPRRLRTAQLALIGLTAIVVVVALADPLGVGRLHRVLAGLMAVYGAVAVAGLEAHIRRPLPELRLSTEGIEGSFGLIAWSDVTSAELATRLGLRTRRVVLDLAPGAMLLPETREFAGSAYELVPPRTLQLETGDLEIDAQTLLREIERFRMYAAEL